ncbi:hypothetical protein RHSIM_Rhsim04G0149600 [Rhododendron simsii]|uniref:hAT-like transposase RNase-H fold domain-containing protein n=1 Tax=Rhododendron simsii TaxID=118357 RepID=A0A834GYR8_RHOSS|nr:hypothetical protein RHSIM_Rhsim04G0149600 [Rhododendron simsii]
MSESPVGSSAQSTNPIDGSGPSQPSGSPVPSSSPLDNHASDNPTHPSDNPTDEVEVVSEKSDDNGKRRYSNALQPLFKVPCRNTMKAEIFKIYEYQRGKTMSLVVSNASRLAITTDMWTSSNQKKGFMAVTAHFIDESWTLQSRILRFIYVPCPHTKEVLCDQLLNCLMDWNIDRKISSITVDNCSTNDAMIDLLWDKLDSTSLMLGGELFHMRCCAHILNLIVKDGLDVIKVGIEKIRDSIAYWTASPKREEKFEETVRQLNVTSTKKLGLDCATRWNSTYLMLQTALLYKDVFIRLSKRDAQYNSLPSELIREMAKRMVEKFDKYWLVVHGVVGVSAVLDPRYKINVLEFYFKLLFPASYKEEVENVRALCYKLLKEYQCPSSGIEGIGDSSSHSSSLDEESLSKYDVYMLRESKRSRTIDTAKLELDHYLSEAVLPKSAGFDVLN